MPDSISRSAKILWRGKGHAPQSLFPAGAAFTGILAVVYAIIKEAHPTSPCEQGKPVPSAPVAKEIHKKGTILA
jgi:hypothetical protein